MIRGAAGFAAGNTGTYNSRSRPFAGVQYAQSEGASYLALFHEFWTATDFARLEPTTTIVSGDATHAMAHLGHEYVVYAPHGGTVGLDLTPTTENFVARWFNPRSGAYQNLGTVAGGSVHSFVAPDTDDWVLSVR